MVRTQPRRSKVRRGWAELLRLPCVVAKPRTRTYAATRHRMFRKPALRLRLAMAILGSFAAHASYACPACGDKLNFGMRFEQQPPGQLIVLAAPGSALADPASNVRIALERAGHDVSVVQSADELIDKLHGHEIDVVVAHWADVGDLQQRLAGVAPEPAVIPVAYEEEDAAAAAAEGASRCLARIDQKRGRKLAETVDEVLERRRKGAPPECETTVANRTQ
jgi:hypothetical protein